jgi:hypothetical protein
VRKKQRHWIPAFAGMTDNVAIVLGISASYEINQLEDDLKQVQGDEPVTFMIQDLQDALESA